MSFRAIFNATSRAASRLPSSRSFHTSIIRSLPMRQVWKKHPSEGPSIPDVHAFFEPQTSTWQYIVADPSTSQAVIIDTVLDYNPASGAISTTSADEILQFITENNLKVTRILETHAHADHLTACQYYKRKLGGSVPVCIGQRITQVQDTFSPKYSFAKSYFTNTFDVYLKDEETFQVGNLICRVVHLPGHTPDHIGYVVGNAVFTGDSIFMPHLGSARTDFPGGNAKELYRSMQKLLSLPDDYRLFVGHDYPADNKEASEVATVGDHRLKNKHVKLGTDEASFISMREARDAILGAPRLLHPSLQVNIRAGKMPPGEQVIKTPLGPGPLLKYLSS